MYELNKLGPAAFEHLVNQLALRVLGPGLSTFAAGPDGGRDAYFEGGAPYPSQTDAWSGVWYFQSKYHAADTSADAQKWLLNAISAELEAFGSPSSRRTWPDIWIVATNVDPSGHAQTGTFDKAKQLVRKARSRLAPRFHIWNGKKIVDLLVQYPEVARHFRHFLTPGHVVAELLAATQESRPTTERVLRYLVIQCFEEHQHTKLDQAGSSADVRPGIHQLFTDVPIRSNGSVCDALRSLVTATSQPINLGEDQPNAMNAERWVLHPDRAPVWFLRGGPGRGKSTIGQFYSQIQRAAIALQPGTGLPLKPGMRDRLEEVQAAAKAADYWPTVPRVPLQIDLKLYAAWLGQRRSADARGFLSYVSDSLGIALEQPVSVGALLAMLGQRSWFVAFDGLDEVPQDTKDVVGREIRHFVEDVAVEHRIDMFVLCTSRPQGYSGQFDELQAATADLIDLSPEQALDCARPLVGYQRAKNEAAVAFERLKVATESGAVRQLMTTPLQAHIMAVVVRDGDRPPERRWQLFTKFYQVIKRREANKNFPDTRLARLLRDDDLLLRSIHNRLGFALHARAEISSGATASMPRAEFESLVRSAVGKYQDKNIDETTDILVRAATERLVLVSTPDNESEVRFDVRQLQEFFAAEFMYESVNTAQLEERLKIVVTDPHWREVAKFLVSALVEANRSIEFTLAAQAIYLANDPGRGRDGATIDRSLARGALIAASLIAEGVLEQDKQFRQRLAPALEPLYAALGSLADVKILCGTTQANSRAWLIDVLSDKVKERQPEQCVGAAIVLASLVTESDSEAELLIRFIERAPLNVALQLANALVRVVGSGAAQRNGALARVNWCSNLILRVFGRAARDAPLSIPFLFSYFDWGGGDLQRPKSTRAKAPGVLECDLWALSLSNRERFGFFDGRGHRAGSVDSFLEFIQEGSQLVPLPSASVVFEECKSRSFHALVASFVAKPSLAALKASLDPSVLKCDEGAYWPDTLPYSLLPISPELPLDEEIRRIADMTVDEFDNCMTSKEMFNVWRMRRAGSTKEMRVASLSGFESSELRALFPVSYARQLIKQLETYRSAKRALSISDRREREECLRRLLDAVTRPEAAAAVLPYGARIMADQPSIGATLRSRLNVSLRRPVTQKSNWAHMFFHDPVDSVVDGFPLDVRREWSLAIACAELVASRYLYRIADDPLRGRMSYAAVDGLVKRFFPRPEDLVDIDINQATSYEGVLISFLVALHPDLPEDSRRAQLAKALAREEWAETSSTYLLVALSNWLGSVGSPTNPLDMQLASLLISGLGRCCPRVVGLASGLLAWREKSDAPVTRGGFDRVWPLQ